MLDDKKQNVCPIDMDNIVEFRSKYHGNDENFSAATGGSRVVALYILD